MVRASLAGWRRGEATGRRAKLDFAHLLRNLADVRGPGRKIVLAKDNLNTHKLSALCKAFPADRASLLADCFEVHQTPKHGRWLNMAEIEVADWQARRNAAATPVDWRFGTEDARVKMKSLYPTIPC